MIRLDRNENPWGATAAVREAVKRALYAPYATTGINRYGDFNQTHLVRTIAAYHGVRPTEVTVGVGGSEILSILAAAFLQEGKLLLTAEPTFDLLPERARAWGGRVITVPLDPAGFYDLEALLGRVTGETRMIYLCNPNNPTGAFHDAAHLAAFTEEVWGRNPRTILVLDEAYIDYTVPEARFDFLPPLRRGRPIVVVRSLSAAHGMAGLRAGYALANRNITQRLTGFLHIPGGPYGQGWAHPEVGLTRLAEAAIEAALTAGEGEIAEIRRQTEINRERLVQGIERFGFSALPSAANFVMIDLGISGDLVCAALCARGILVRSGGAFHPRFQTSIRVSVGTTAEIDAFLTALAEILDAPSQEGEEPCPPPIPYGY